MRVLGIDPGTRATGYGLVERGPRDSRLVECGVIRPRETDTAGRLADIHTAALELVDRLAPNCVAIESAFHGRNARTSMVLGQARGVLVLAAALRGLPVHEYAPREVKKHVTGTGAAGKEQVSFMVQKLLRLGDPPRPADAADGCAVALCHLLSASRPRPRGPLAERMP